MGERNRDRELREARTRYVGALARYRAAMATWEDSGMPMDPGPDLEPYPWTLEQTAALHTVAQAVAELADARRTWDSLRREWRPTR